MMFEEGFSRASPEKKANNLNKYPPNEKTFGYKNWHFCRLLTKKSKLRFLARPFQNNIIFSLKYDIN